jgi:hypothetical protein
MQEGGMGGSVEVGFTASTSAGAGFAAFALSLAGIGFLAVALSLAGVGIVVVAAAAVKATFSASNRIAVVAEATAGRALSAAFFFLWAML